MFWIRLDTFGSIFMDTFGFLDTLICIRLDTIEYVWIRFFGYAPFFFGYALLDTQSEFRKKNKGIHNTLFWIRLDTPA